MSALKYSIVEDCQHYSLSLYMFYVTDGNNIYGFDPRELVELFYYSDKLRRSRSLEPFTNQGG